MFLVALAGADDAGALTLAWTFDIQNAFVALFALVRFRASSIGRERRLFGTLMIYALAYMAVAGFYNHFVDDGMFGVLASPLIGLPFLLLAALALRGPGSALAPAGGRMFERVVVAGSPLILPCALLIVSAALVPHMRGRCAPEVAHPRVALDVGHRPPLVVS